MLQLFFSFTQYFFSSSYFWALTQVQKKGFSALGSERRTSDMAAVPTNTWKPKATLNKGVLRAFGSITFQQSSVCPRPCLQLRPRLIVLLLLPLFLFSLTLEAGTRRYRLTWRDNPATNMTIGFELYEATSARVVYDTQDHGRNVKAYRLTANPARSVNHAGMQNVFVRLGGLQPGTTYYFLVVDERGLSQRMSFETPPDNPSQPLSIIAGGDSRNNRQAALNGNRLVSKLLPHFVLFGGDMTNTDTPAEWQAWFDDWQLTISQDGRMTPIVPARGNHERANASIYNLFDVPHPDVYYAFSFGGGLLRTYTLNSSFPPGGNQLDWLTNDLFRAKATWKIAQYHHAMRPHTASKPERDELITLWATQFTRYGVDLVVESDAHTVKQTWPIRPSRAPGSSEGFIRDDKRGTVYVGEGCWGAPLRANNDNKPWTRASGRFNQFKWIWLDATQMQVRTVDIDRSSGTVAEVNPLARFQTPPGIVYWNPQSTGEVLRIDRREQSPASNTRSGSLLTNPSPTMQSIEPPTPTVLQRDAQGVVRVGFKMPVNGQPQIIVVDAGKNLLWQKKLAVRGPGPYVEEIQLPALPPANGMELVVRAGGKVVAKYILR
jgi:hypothetical protein